MIGAGLALGAVFIIAAVVITIVILYLLNIQNALKEVSDTNRQVPFINTWLLLIPLFNIVYAFIFYPKMAESFRREYEERELPQDGDFGKSIGLIMATLGVARLIPIDILQSTLSLVGLILLIVLWVKVAKYKQTLIAHPNTNGNSNIRNNSSDLLDN